MNGLDGLVVDASVAVKWHLPDENLVEQANLLLNRHMRGQLLLAAPAFIRYEVAQSFLRAERARRVSRAYTQAAFGRFLAFGLHLRSDADGLVVAAQRIAGIIGGSVYDALYVATAENLGFALVTDDRGLIRRAMDYPVTVHPLADVGALL
jgi:predicted nucleic acid-binding protein